MRILSSATLTLIANLLGVFPLLLILLNKGTVIKVIPIKHQKNP